MISFRDYIDYSEKHLILAEEDINSGKHGSSHIISSIILSWSAIECFVNNRLDEFDTLPEGLFELHEKAFLTEQTLTFQNTGDKAGQFVIKGPSYRRLSDKILFLIAKCGSTVDKGRSPWQDFEKFKYLRDSLIHPRPTRPETMPDADAARECIQIAKDVILLISEGLGHKVTF